MKIGIYFFVHTHTSFLEVLLGQVPEGAQVDLYSPRFFHGYKGAGLSIKSPSLGALLWRMRTYDAVVVDEVTGRYLLWLPLFWLWRKRVYLVVHNLKSWTDPRFFNGVGGFVHSCLRWFIWRLFKHFIVVGSRMKEYAEGHAAAKSFYFVPFGWQESRPGSLSERGGSLSIVVPGTISTRRKYERLLLAAQDEALQNKVSFTFLGRPEDDYGRNVIAKVRELGLDNVRVFEDFIPDEEYQRYLQEADFILSDFEVDYTTRYGQTEVYGLTKETGVSFILLAFAKPGILPADFVGMAELEGQVLRFTDYTSLRRLLLEAWADRSIIERLQQAGIAGRKCLSLKVDRVFGVS